MKLTSVKKEWDHNPILEEGWTGRIALKRVGNVVSINATITAGQTPSIIVVQIPSEFRPHVPAGQVLNGLAVDIGKNNGEARRYNYYLGRINFVNAAPSATYEIRDTFLTTSPPPRFLERFSRRLRALWGGRSETHTDHTHRWGGVPHTTTSPLRGRFLRRVGTLLSMVTQPHPIQGRQPSLSPGISNLCSPESKNSHAAFRLQIRMGSKPHFDGTDWRETGHPYRHLQRNYRRGLGKTHTRCAVLPRGVVAHRGPTTDRPTVCAGLAVGGVL